jgi:hypothetical protein
VVLVYSVGGIIDNSACKTHLFDRRCFANVFTLLHEKVVGESYGGSRINMVIWEGVEGGKRSRIDKAGMVFKMVYG